MLVVAFVEIKIPAQVQANLSLAVGNLTEHCRGSTLYVQLSLTDFFFSTSEKKYIFNISPALRLDVSDGFMAV